MKRKLFERKIDWKAVKEYMDPVDGMIRDYVLRSLPVNWQGQVTLEQYPPMAVVIFKRSSDSLRCAESFGDGEAWVSVPPDEEVIRISELITAFAERNHLRIWRVRRGDGALQYELKPNYRAFQIREETSDERQ